MGLDNSQYGSAKPEQMLWLNCIKFARYDDGSFINPRGAIADTTGLQGSMKEAGQKEAIRVFRDGSDAYVVISGHNRVTAARALGWEYIKAIIEPEPDDLLAEMTLANVRTDPAPSRRAEAYARLHEAGWSLERLSRREALSLDGTDGTPGLRDYLDLAEASDGLKKLIDSGKISWSALKKALRQPKQVQDKLGEAEGKALQVRNIGKQIRAIKNGTDEKVGEGPNALIAAAIGEGNTKIVIDFKALIGQVKASWRFLSKTDRNLILAAAETLQEMGE